ncbi:MAG: HlyD family efflux transporter periplasmic adaptor subunit [Planctomyces sp.]|nr:HlyD family efflux transporter periplasmic adaptor subunit [Planctomyces sp.]
MRQVYVLLFSALVGAAATCVAAPQEAARTRIEARNTVINILDSRPLSSEVPGKLKLVVPMEEGMPVRKNEVVIVLEDGPIRSAYKEAVEKSKMNAEIEFSQKALDKAKVDEEVQKEQNQKLPEAPPFSPAEMRQARIEVEKAEAQLKKSNEDQTVALLAAETKAAELAQYEIRSPIDGVVTKVDRRPGQSVRQGDPIITVTDLTVMKAELSVPYIFRDQIFIGDEVEVQIFEPASGGGSTFGSKTGGELTPLSGAPGVPISDPKKANPATPAAAQPTADIQANTGRPLEKFIGRVYFIAPDIEVSAQQLKVYVSVPNRQDSAGRYLLHQGVTAKAWILAR